MSRSLIGSKVLITGGAGFIGSHLAERLLAEGAQEIGILDDLSRGRVENLDNALCDDRVKFIRGDIRERKLVRRLALGCNVICHFAAWRIHRCEAQPRQALEVMIDGTYNTFEAAASARVPRVIFASSASVYGQASEFPTPETSPPYNNTTLYGWAKLHGEGLAKWFVEKRGVKVICLRFFNVYGPRMDSEGKYTEVLVRWLEALSENKPPVVHGDGSASYDFVHVHDVVRAIILAATSGRSWGVYNVGSGRETNLATLASLLAKASGKENIKCTFQPAAAPLVSRRLACLRLIGKELGYRPTIELEAGLKQLADWYQSCKCATK